jgi:hypothetical protein
MLEEKATFQWQHLDFFHQITDKKEKIKLNLQVQIIPWTQFHKSPTPLPPSATLSKSSVAVKSTVPAPSLPATSVSQVHVQSTPPVTAAPTLSTHVATPALSVTEVAPVNTHNAPPTQIVSPTPAPPAYQPTVGPTAAPPAYQNQQPVYNPPAHNPEENSQTYPVAPQPTPLPPSQHIRSTWVNL